MAWSIIRQATDEDRERLDAAARRFVERHELRRWSEDVVSDVELAIADHGRQFP